jgi:hypothetical protein
MFYFNIHVSLLSSVAAYTFLNFRTDGTLSHAEIIIRLHAYPYLRRIAEVYSETKSSVRGYSAFAVYYGADPAGRHCYIAGQLINTDPHGFHKFFQKNLARVNRVKKLLLCFHKTPLMIVCYFNIKCVAIFPTEADSPLIIDPDAVLPPAISFEGLYPITGRNS